MSQKSIALPSLSDLITAWETMQAANPDLNLDIEGGDTGGWYLVWDQADWDRSYPLDALRPVEEMDAWSALAHRVFCPPNTTGTPVTYPHRSSLARPGHRAVMGADDDGHGYDAGDRTYSWQTLDSLISALALAVPEYELRRIAAAWVDGQANKMRWALERVAAPIVEIDDAAQGGGHSVAVPSGRERLGLGAE